MRPLLLRYGAHFSSLALLYWITFIPFGQRVSNAVDRVGWVRDLARSGGGGPTPLSPQPAPSTELPAELLPAPGLLGVGVRAEGGGGAEESGLQEWSLPWSSQI